VKTIYSVTGRKRKHTNMIMISYHIPNKLSYIKMYSATNKRRGIAACSSIKDLALY